MRAAIDLRGVGISIFFGFAFQRGKRVEFSLDSVAGNRVQSFDPHRIAAFDLFTVSRGGLAFARYRGLILDFGPGQPDLGHRRERGRSEEHTSELQSLMRISYAAFCLI